MKKQLLSALCAISSASTSASQPWWPMDPFALWNDAFFFNAPAPETDEIRAIKTEIHELDQHIDELHRKRSQLTKKLRTQMRVAQQQSSAQRQERETGWQLQEQDGMVIFTVRAIDTKKVDASCSQGALQLQTDAGTIDVRTENTYLTVTQKTEQKETQSEKDGVVQNLSSFSSHSIVTRPISNPVDINKARVHHDKAKKEIVIQIPYVSAQAVAVDVTE